MGHVSHVAGGIAAYPGMGLYVQDGGLCLAETEPQKPYMVLRAGLLEKGNAEICLLAKRGKPKRHSAAIHQFIISPIEQHSKKPDVTRDKIFELAGDLPRMELFARQKCPCWDAWGNEVESDLTLNPS